MIHNYFEPVFNRQTVRGRIFRGTFWSLVGSVVAQGTGVLGSIFCARILGTVRFGELGIVRSTVLMFGVLAGTGLGLAATKHVAESRIINPLKTGRMIGLLMNVAFLLGGGVTLICLILAAPLAKWAMQAPHLAGALQMGCLMLLLNTLNGVQLGAICGFEAFRTQSRMIILDGLFSVVLIPAGAFFYGVTGAMGGSVLAALLGFILKQQAMNRECKHADIQVFHRNVSSEFPVLWKFVVPAVLIGLTIQPFEWLARLMLVRQPNGYAELGVFTAVFAWAQLIVFLPGQISTPTMPILSNLLAGGEVLRLKKIVLSSQGLVVSLAVLTGVPLALLAPYILGAYGPDFVSGRFTLMIMIGAQVIGTATLITRAFFAAVDRMWWQAMHTALWGLGLIVGCHFFISHGGGGLAISYLGAYSLLAALQFITQALVMNQLKRQYAEK